MQTSNKCRRGENVSNFTSVWTVDNVSHMFFLTTLQCTSSLVNMADFVGTASREWRTARREK